MNDVIIIAGPTAIGKTSLSLNLANNLNTEIISADSMQIYKNMNIGTAKITKTEMNGIKHHLIDIINPKDNFSVQNFQELALKIIKELHQNNKIPIIVGGTGLYIDSLTHNYDFLNVKPNYKLRQKLEEIYEKNPNYLLEEVYKIDKNLYNHLGINDKKKLIRAIEVFKIAEKKINYKRMVFENSIKYHLYVLNCNREELYNKINQRVDLMLEKGLIKEVKNLINMGLTEQNQSMKAIGYKEVLNYLNNNINYDTMIEKLKQNSRNYAKRQLTWFRRNKFSKWISTDNKTNHQILEEILDDFHKNRT